ncbi:MAG: hypothetical protein WC655_19255 [Candidatus Hydrogenedentales bacterium]|jgi:hypothetical protein
MTTLEELVFQRIFWLNTLDEVITAALKASSPIPAGDLIEAECNVELLTRQIREIDPEEAGLDLEWDTYTEKRILDLRIQIANEGIA